MTDNYGYHQNRYISKGDDDKEMYRKNPYFRYFDFEFDDLLKEINVN